MRLNLFLPILLISTALLSGCMQTRYITEQYIKSEIQQHKEGQFSSISTYSIHKGISLDGSSYIELTGYKQGDRKGLVIGSDKYYTARKKFAEDKTIIIDYNYIELNISQCQGIIDNYKILQDKISKEKPKANEEIYHDYAVSGDLVISFKKSMGGSNVNYIDFWVKGHKFRLSTIKVIQKLKKFMNY